MRALNVNQWLLDVNQMVRYFSIKIRDNSIRKYYIRYFFHYLKK